MLTSTKLSVVVLAWATVCNRHAFDNLTNLSSMAKGVIETLQALLDEMEGTCCCCNQVRSKHVNQPKEWIANQLLVNGV